MCRRLRHKKAGNDSDNNGNDNDNATETLFEEVNRMYTIREAINEAKRCLHCKVPQCKKACPIEKQHPRLHPRARWAIWARR